MAQIQVAEAEAQGSFLSAASFAAGYMEAKALGKVCVGRSWKRFRLAWTGLECIGEFGSETPAHTSLVQCDLNCPMYLLVPRLSGRQHRVAGA
jgi:hypothetical protein